MIERIFPARFFQEGVRRGWGKLIYSLQFSEVEWTEDPRYAKLGENVSKFNHRRFP